MTLKFGSEVTQGHRKWYHLKAVAVSLAISGLGFVQGHWKWHHLIEGIRVPISIP